MSLHRAVASKTELKCKLCRHPRRAEIDELLLSRSLREKDEDGNLINLEYVLAKLAEWDVPHPTPDNVKGHWKNHVTVMSSAVVEEQEEKREVALNSNEPVDVDKVLDKLIRVGESDLDVLIEQTGKSGVTVDQVLKAIQVKTSRKQDEKVATLLGGAVAAIGGAFKALQPAPAPKQIESVVIDGDTGEVEA